MSTVTHVYVVLCTSLVVTVRIFCRQRSAERRERRTPERIQQIVTNARHRPVAVPERTDHRFGMRTLGVVENGHVSHQYRRVRVLSDVQRLSRSKNPLM